ncbi:hypothetical protein QWZ06_15770 [Chryseobacterium tructae]|uniref:DUF7000 family protein n=1 Tax=Chryseobacterium tructae TaxID=1037380 RepID=A0ABV7XY19_9FLAO|nr:hypothetical protein [Chryseobacterium tructae]MDN3693644.1 hypothetical protein [Chryseobacterium tructae]
MKDINITIKSYQKIVAKNEIPQAYMYLMRLMTALKADFSRHFENKFSVGNISPGYMDYTYFPFFDAPLRENKLRFGIVLNHKKMQLELWLMGQNAEVQQEYWAILKSTPWNKHLTSMPKYSVLETVLIESPDFENKEVIYKAVINKTLEIVPEIMKLLS